MLHAEDSDAADLGCRLNGYVCVWWGGVFPPPSSTQESVWLERPRVNRENSFNNFPTAWRADRHGRQVKTLRIQEGVRAEFTNRQVMITSSGRGPTHLGFLGGVEERFRASSGPFQ